VTPTIFSGSPFSQPHADRVGILVAPMGGACGFASLSRMSCAKCYPAFAGHYGAKSRWCGRPASSVTFGRHGTGATTGAFSIASLGADYLVNPGMLLGGFVQLDMMGQENAGSGAMVDGT